MRSSGRLLVLCALATVSIDVLGCAEGQSNLGDTGGRDATGGLDAAGAVPDAHVAVIDASSSCGNATIEASEECEGTDLGGETCVSQGYAGGTLRCTSTCVLDKSACEDDVCGNGTIDAGEECDGANLGTGTCASEGFVSGELRCGPGCTYETSACSSCGNGTLNAGEECDGANLGGATCVSRGFTGGTLSCSASCGIDDATCFRASCGNGTREPSEDCDGTDLGGRTCSSYGFFGGTLSCDAASCTTNLALCNNCGNGTIEGIEQCDGTNLGGATCVTRGFSMGTLGCSTTCGYDTSGCSTSRCGNGVVESGETCDDGNPTSGDGCTGCAPDAGYTCTGAPSTCAPICGDGMIRGGEECDGANLAGQTCVTRGFTAGTLSCSPSSCSFVTTACLTTNCGNGVIDSGERCDDGNAVANDGCSPTCTVEPGFYLPVRLRNGDGSNHGMLEVNYAGVWRDVCDDTYDIAAQQAMANVVCRQLGFTGTGHQFINAFGGGTSTPVMDDVVCTGTESNLSQCAFSGWNQENCSASEAVGIRCMPAQGDIRLVAGPSGMEGRLQVFHGGSWGEVCDDYFDGAYGSSYFGYSTTTVCQQLGYAGGTFLSTYDAPGDTFVLDDVNCTGTERRIGDCPHLAWGSENCSRTEGAGFRCELYGEGGVRLVDGSARNNGRVEVLHSNVWGTVCDDFLSAADARQSSFLAVTCGQLGFRRAGSALLTSAVVDGVEPTWLDDVQCTGSETSLPMCMHRGWAVENCSHSEDIGATCTP